MSSSCSRILIVDDEADLVDLLADRLEYYGYDVDEAQNGKEGLGAYIAGWYQNNPFDLLLLDICMPGLTGFELVTMIRKFEQDHKVKTKQQAEIIILTASKEAYQTAVNQGQHEVMLKPYEEASLMSLIESKLEKKKS